MATEVEATECAPVPLLAGYHHDVLQHDSLLRECVVSLSCSRSLCLDSDRVARVCSVIKLILQFCAENSLTHTMKALQAAPPPYPPSLTARDTLPCGRTSPPR